MALLRFFMVLSLATTECHLRQSEGIEYHDSEEALKTTPRCIIKWKKCNPENIACVQIYNPVCGCDGNTYSNSCAARFFYCNRWYTQGECRSKDDDDESDNSYLSPASEPSPEPSQGSSSGSPSEASSYSCIIPDDECNTNNFQCPLNFDPVCGCDGNTYTNACFAEYQYCNRYFEPGPCADQSV